jgi:ADP-ribosyl-[dinitrogen reductase] hydrolase
MFQIAYRQSALTHYDHLVGKCVILYCKIVRDILLGGNLQNVINENVKNSSIRLNPKLAPEKIETSGYVAHTLEAALNCAYQTESFEQALIMAVNLGGDADTIGAVTGGIVGASYGLESIPLRWLDKLIVKNEILFLADKLIATSSEVEKTIVS